MCATTSSSVRTFAAEARHLAAAGEVVALLKLEVVRDGRRQHGLGEAVVELEARLVVLQAACARQHGYWGAAAADSTDTRTLRHSDPRDWGFTWARFTVANAASAG